jgi:dimethylargininase
MHSISSYELLPKKRCGSSQRGTDVFENVIVKKPCRAIEFGITSAPELGKPDYGLAVRQHEKYIEALKECGVAVTVLEADEEFPDSCFVEDTAVLTRNCAIVSNPGAPSRTDEVRQMIPVLKGFFPDDRIKYIKPPGTLEGGDVMMAGDHFYVGRSARTNAEGIRQFIEILERYGLSGSEVLLEKVLHLKTGVNYIENNIFLVTGEFVDKEDFAGFHKIVIPEEEAYAANCIWVNGKVIVPAGYPVTEKAIRSAGYETILVDTSEYRKLDGGLSCLSLRF